MDSPSKVEKKYATCGVQVDIDNRHTHLRAGPKAVIAPQQLYAQNLFSHYLNDGVIAAFRSTLLAEGCIVAGSSPLHFVCGQLNPNIHGLDIYGPGANAINMINWLLHNGCTEPRFTMNSREWVDDFNSSIGRVEIEGVWEVRGVGNTVIQVFVCNGNPIEHVTHAHSTGLMNILDGDYLYICFPEETLALGVFLVNRTKYPTGTEGDALNKYGAQGWYIKETVDRETALGMGKMRPFAPGPRKLDGDRTHAVKLLPPLLGVDDRGRRRDCFEVSYMYQRGWRLQVQYNGTS